MKNYTIEKVSNNACIYLLKSPVNKYYVGQSWNVENRWKYYKSLNAKGQTKLYNALKKYGPENFIYSIIFITKDQKLLDKKEIYYIKKFKCVENGYNIRRGGIGGKMSEETKKKLSILNSGKNSVWFNKKHSKNTIIKMSESWTKERKLKHSKRMAGNRNYFYNKKHSNKTKKFITKIALNTQRNKKWKYLYVFECINGIRIYVKCISRYCKLNNFHQPGVRRAIREKKLYKKIKVYKIKCNKENLHLAIDKEIYPN